VLAGVTFSIVPQSILIVAYCATRIARPDMWNMSFASARRILSPPVKSEAPLHRSETYRQFSGQANPPAEVMNHIFLSGSL